MNLRDILRYAQLCVMGETPVVSIGDKVAAAAANATTTCQLNSQLEDNAKFHPEDIGNIPSYRPLGFYPQALEDRRSIILTAYLVLPPTSFLVSAYIQVSVGGGELAAELVWWPAGEICRVTQQLLWERSQGQQS